MPMFVYILAFMVPDRVLQTRRPCDADVGTSPHRMVPPRDRIAMKLEPSFHRFCRSRYLE